MLIYFRCLRFTADIDFRCSRCRLRYADIALLASQHDGCHASLMRLPPPPPPPPVVTSFDYCRAGHISLCHVSLLHMPDVFALDAAMLFVYVLPPCLLPDELLLRRYITALRAATLRSYAATATNVACCQSRLLHAFAGDYFLVYFLMPPLCYARLLLIVAVFIAFDTLLLLPCQMPYFIILLAMPLFIAMPCYAIAAFALPDIYFFT